MIKDIQRALKTHPDAENHFSREDWILGKRNHHSGEESSQHKYPQIDELLNHVNVDELMNNIDDLFNFDITY